MKSILLVFTLLLAPVTEGANQNPPAGTCILRVHVTGFRSQRGAAGASIFKSADGWPEQNDKAFAQNEVPISGNEATIPFHLPPGKYGVVALDDQKKNHKLDRNLLGVPTEGFGFANNPAVFLTAPPFEAASVNVGCPVTNIDVKLIYK